VRNRGRLAREGLRRFLRWLVLLRGSPEALGRGMAIGTVVAFTPTLGIQIPLALFLTTIANANRPISIVPVMCQKSANPKHEQFWDLGGWHRRASWHTSHTLTEIRWGP
jgi:uncharacterized protein (DUF2062 family)